MGLKYKVISTTKGGVGTKGQKMYYPILTGTEQIGIQEVADILEKRSSMTGADIRLVLYGLLDLIPELLAKGNTVNLQDFGTFRLQAKTAVANSPEEVSEKNIYKVRIGFIPGKLMKNNLKNLSFKRVEG